MWRSLERLDGDALLWVLTLDDETAELLRTIGGVRLRVVLLGELIARDDRLRAVQAERPRKEFIFTLTPCLVRHLFQTRPEIDRLVYLDADLFSFSDPDVIWQEWGPGSVFVAPHRYPAWHDDAPRYGKFNVGVLGFARDHTTRAGASTLFGSRGSRDGRSRCADLWWSGGNAESRKRRVGSLATQARNGVDDLVANGRARIEPAGRGMRSFDAALCPRVPPVDRRAASSLAACTSHRASPTATP